MALGEDLRRRHPQAPRRPLLQGAGVGRRGGGLVEGPARPLVIGSAGVGRRDEPGGAVEQPHAEPLLQPAHRLAHGRLGDGEVGGGAREAAGLHHPHERRQAFQKLVHICSLKPNSVLSCATLPNIGRYR